MNPRTPTGQGPEPLKPSMAASPGSCSSFELTTLKASNGVPEGVNLTIDWSRLRSGFVEWLEAKDLCEPYRKQLTSVLDRHLEAPIASPRDLVRLFSKYRSKPLKEAVSQLLTYCEKVLSYPYEHVASLRRVLPSIRSGRDLTVVSEDQVKNALRKLQGDGRDIFIVLLASGLRVTEALKLIEDYDPSKLTWLSEGCARHPLMWLRRSKEAYYAYLSPSALKALEKLKGSKYNPSTVRGFYENVLSPKYLRKYAYNKMMELGMPESAADFVEGRAAHTVGGQSYMWRLQQADRHYPLYARHVEALIS